MNHRKRNEHKYTKALFNTGDVQICSYCGDIADTKDHVFPLRWADNQEKGQMIIVPACLSCNTMAGSRKFSDIYEKLVWLHERIKRKHKAVLHMPDWTQEELQEVSPEMQEYIQGQLNLRERILERVVWGKEVIKKVERNVR